MEDLRKDGFGRSSVDARSNNSDNWPSLWNSSRPLAQKSNYASGLYMNMNSLTQENDEIKFMGYQKPEHDLKRSQSTGQSHQEASNLHAQSIFSQSGDDNSCTKEAQVQLKQFFSLGTPQIDHCQSTPCISHQSIDPYFGGVMPSFGSDTYIHSQMVGMGTSGRVPLPLEPAEVEPIYVNAKQYNGIMRRRQLRAKLEAQNKLAKERKPYLHESRHLHAMKRARGAGGRFLNKKELEQQSGPSDDKIASEGCHGFASGLHPHSRGIKHDWGSNLFTGSRERVPVMR